MSKFTGKLKPPVVDFLTGKISAVIEINENFRQAYEDLKDCEKISVEIKRYRRKRSLDANAYYWTLVSKLATVLKTSNPEIHNRMLSLYGFPECIGGKSVFVTIPDTEEAEAQVAKSTTYHLQPSSQTREGKDGVVYRTYRILRGSSTYNTEEMSRLIDGIISECKDAGIPDTEIATPDEKAQLKERYGVEI